MIPKDCKRLAEVDFPIAVALEQWQGCHRDIDSLRKAYQEKVLDWVVKSMEFEKEPVSMSRLEELLEKEMATRFGVSNRS